MNIGHPVVSDTLKNKEKNRQKGTILERKEQRKGRKKIIEDMNG